VSESAALGLLPLQWAAAMLLNALEPGPEAEGQVQATTALLHRRGSARLNGQRLRWTRRREAVKQCPATGDLDGVTLE